MPRISVVIAAYNGVSRYVEQAVASVLAQTFRDFELIVVDDASSDDTVHVISAYPQAHCIRRTNNGGQAGARNDGAQMARGEFLAFLDQDDLWEPTFLEETTAVLERRPDAAVVHSDGFQVNERNEILEYDSAMKQAASITQLLRGGHDTATSGTLLRKHCFDAVGGYDHQLSIWEDIDLAIRLYRRFPLIHLPKPLYRHRLYAHNASRGIPSERALSGRRRFLEKHAHVCQPGTPEARALSRDWAHYYGDLGKYHRKAGHREDARRAFWQSVQYCPFDHKAVLRLMASYLPERSSTSTSLV